MQGGGTFYEQGESLRAQLQETNIQKTVKIKKLLL